jgi:predicted  nucleic acid-binding Zn-ribbon protein
MNPQLQVLIALQDVLLMIREAKDPSSKKALGKMGFKMNNLEALEATKSGLERQLSPTILREYSRTSGRYGRIVVPVINSTCYGCFVKIPSAIDASDDRNKILYRCENCGMFLYWVDK